MSIGIEKVVSGGQTGADRMGLDWAIWHEIPHGGWCPKFRKAEDGKIPPQYQLTETPSSDYVQRTDWNVRDSDGTLIFSLGHKLSRGSAKTAFFAERHGKPFLHVHPGLSYNLALEVLRFVRDNNVKIPPARRRRLRGDWLRRAWSAVGQLDIHPPGTRVCAACSLNATFAVFCPAFSCSCSWPRPPGPRRPTRRSKMSPLSDG